MNTNIKEEWFLLPKKISPEKEIWEQIGFQFLDIENDDVLCKVKLPTGWELQQEKYQIGLDILDENKMTRGKIFYKSKFENSNHMYLNTRYSIVRQNISENAKLSSIYFGNETEKLFVAGLLDKTREATAEDRLKHIEEEEELLQKAENWANENYPDWENVCAYWDLPIKQNQKVKTKK